MTEQKNLIRAILSATLTIACASYVSAQEIRIHSHNDYRQRMPFYQAYSQGAASIEADIYAVEGSPELLVAHDRAELPTAPTLEELYIQPLVHLYVQNGGRAWRKAEQLLVLLIDLKTAAVPTLDRLVEKLGRYPEVFDPAVNPYAVRVVVSGEKPAAEAFDDYPAFILFDGSRTDYAAARLERIYMISFDLRSYTQWDGEGELPADDAGRLRRVIDEVHALGKPVRFWETPDGETSWRTFGSLGVDFINTDRPEACTAFFRELKKE
jgi:alkaline phosphatase